jgi:spermidine/putrescine transport system permease protein
MTSENRAVMWMVRLYLVAFFVYLFLPLVVMGAATFNDSRFPTITPWTGTTLKWFGALFNDSGMWRALGTSVIVALGVIALSLPVGMAAALLLNAVHGRARTVLYGLMVSPLLTPGVIIGISMLVFWNRHFGLTGGFTMMVFAQSCYIAAYVMLMVTARLQRFDSTLEEAALNLGASHWQVFRRILLPFLTPTLVSGALLAFLQSFENYNTTLFVRGLDTTLTVYIASKVRTGVTPAVNALGLLLISLTVLAAIVWEIKRRRQRQG